MDLALVKPLILNSLMLSLLLINSLTLHVQSVPSRLRKGNLLDEEDLNIFNYEPYSNTEDSEIERDPYEEDIGNYDVKSDNVSGKLDDYFKFKEESPVDQLFEDLFGDKK